jgi:glycerol kinase
MQKYLMALDQGTTSSRCILFNRNSKIEAVSQREFKQYYPKEGYVEHDPMEIWSGILGTAVEAMASIGAEADEIYALGITNQRETTVIWNKYTGKPVYNAIVWQCRRTADMIEKIKEDGMAGVIEEKTGLIPDAYFSATKIRWILENVPGVREKAQKGELLFGTVDTWLIYNLTHGKVFATDYTNASRTMLFNIHTLEWDKELLDYFEIPECMLAHVYPSSYKFGYTDPSCFGAPVLIGAAAGDQQSALFGQCCFEKGGVKNTYGTGCFMLMNTGKIPVKSKNRLITTIAAGEDRMPDYCLEGSVFVAGAAVQWLRDELGIIKRAPDSEEMAKSVPDTLGVYIVPAFTGLGAPYWNAYARGTIVGMTRGFSKEHMVRAVLESIAYQTYDILMAMRSDVEKEMDELLTDGGASNNAFLMQFQADILGKKVIRPACTETTALGAAYLAGLSCGVYSDKDEIKKNMSIDRQFEPQMDDKIKNEKLAGWRRAVKTAVYYASLDN